MNSRLQMPDDNPSTIGWLNPRIARWLTPILLLFGLECSLVLGKANYANLRLLAMILSAVALGLIPPVNRAFNCLWNAIAAPSPAARRWTALLIWIISSLFLYSTQRYEKIAFQPKWE